MSKNQFQIKRTAFTHVVHAGHASATASTQTGAYIPAGAIVTGINIFSYGAPVLATGSDVTMTPYVSGTALASNSNKVSAVVIQTALRPMVLADTDGVHVPSGAYLDVDFGSSGDSDSTGMTGDFDIYVDYLYCPDRDAS